MRMLDSIKVERVWGKPVDRWIWVFLFVLNAVAVIGALITGNFFITFPFNLFFSLFCGWAAWPTLTGNTFSKDDVESNDISNS